MYNEDLRPALEKCVAWSREKSIVSEERDKAMKEFDQKLEDIENELNKADTPLWENLACIYIEGGEGVIFRDTKKGRKKISKAVEEAGNIDVEVDPVTSTDHFDDLLTSMDVDGFLNNIKSIDEVIAVLMKQKKKKNKRERKRNLWGCLSTKK